MRRRFGRAVAMIALGAAAALAQEAPEQGECQKKPEARKKGHPMQMMGAFTTFRALRSIAGDLNGEQQAKLGEARAKMGEKMKKAREEFEADLGGILTAEQMEKFKKAKESGPGMRGRNPAQMAQMMEVGKTFRALGSIEGELNEEQKTKLNEVRERIVKKMQEDLESELGNILTANQMEKYKKARESTPQFGMRGPGRGRRGGHEGPAQERHRNRFDEPADRKEE